MKGNLIDGKDVRVTDFFQRAEKALKTLDELVKTTQYSFDGQRFLTDRELSQLLKISRRALQAYRTAKIIPYYLISGKVIYKESEIQRMWRTRAKEACTSKSWYDNRGGLSGPPRSLIDARIRRRHPPNDLGRGRPLDDPSPEYLGVFGFEPKGQCRNHFERVNLDRATVFVAFHTTSCVFAQNAALADRADIGPDSRYEDPEQVGDPVLRQPHAAARRTNGHSAVFDGYGLRSHLHLFWR